MPRLSTVLRLAVVAAAAATVALVAIPAPANAGMSSRTLDRLCERQFNDTVRRFDAAFLAKDLTTFTSFYSEQATVITNAGRVLKTKPEIVANFAGLFRYDFTATFPVIKQSVVGCRTGVVISDFTLDIASINLHAHFVSNVTFTHISGRWQVLVDNSSAIAGG